MKKTHRILIIIGGITLSIAILVYAADLRNRGYIVSGNTDIKWSLDNSGQPPSGEPGTRSNIPEHGTVKEIANFSCTKNVFVPAKTSSGFSSWYNAAHNCYDITTMPQPACGSSNETCTEGTDENSDTLYGKCGKEGGCSEGKRTKTYTWDCTNLQGTIGCTEALGCLSDIACQAAGGET